MEVVQGIAVLAELINTLTQAVGNASMVSGLIQKAQGEGRSTFNDDEWAQIAAVNSQSRAALVAAIQKALNGG